MSRFLFTSLFLTISLISFGQDYIITMKSDTVSGTVKLLSYDLMDRVQIQDGKKKTIYTALQVRSASIKGETYAPVKYDNGIRMMKVLRSGFLSLFGHRAQGQAGFDTRVLQKIGANPIEVPNIGFRKFVGDLVADCPTVADKVKSSGYDRNSIETMVDEYNACVADANARRIAAAAGPSRTPTTELIEQMKLKVTASNLSSKNEVNDLLTSIADKLRKNETIPVYMKEGLKGYIGESEDLKADMNQLLTLIDK